MSTRSAREDLAHPAPPVLNVNSSPHSSGTYEKVVTIEQQPESWGQCTQAYDHFAQSVTRPFAEDASRLVRITPGARVLDVGAGTGAFSLIAARRGARVMAADFSEHMVRYLKAKCRVMGIDSLSAAVMDGQALALDGGTFDVAASLFSLIFFPDPGQGFREMVRVLRPGGQAVVASWAPPRRVELMQRMGEAAMSAMWDVPGDGDPQPWTRLSCPLRLEQGMRDAGFVNVHVVTVKHVWTVDRAEHLAKLLPIMTPSYAAMFNSVSNEQRRAFCDALVQDFQQRQGTGPFAVTSEALLGVGSKPAPTPLE